MNVDSLLKCYFKNCEAQPLIEVFDNENIYNVYSDIVKSLTNYPDIELSVMQALSYCFYEVLDNRTDCESQYNEEFAPTDDLEQLW